jgi:hypothetical protein
MPVLEKMLIYQSDALTVMIKKTDAPAMRLRRTGLRSANQGDVV